VTQTPLPRFIVDGSQGSAPNEKRSRSGPPPTSALGPAGTVEAANSKNPQEYHRRRSTGGSCARDRGRQSAMDGTRIPLLQVAANRSRWPKSPAHSPAPAVSEGQLGTRTEQPLRENRSHNTVSIVGRVSNNGQKPSKLFLARTRFDCADVADGADAKSPTRGDRQARRKFSCWPSPDAYDVISLGGRFMVHHSIFCSNFRDRLIRARSSVRSSIAVFLYRPCLSAFSFPLGAPDPGAPPCIRHRRRPRTAGDLQGWSDRVRAPQRGLASIGPVLRG
jgi:hypothetical protein